ncbi:hypothetical protein KUV61_04775 [Nocardioides marinus]|nr:hypothetical protein [Nocardioides marinus]
MNLDLVLPISVIALAFTVKLFVDRSTSLPDFVASILELPVDIMFLAISLMVGLAIASADGENEHTIYLILLIILAIIVVGLWRKSAMFFENEHFKMSVGLAVASYTISVTSVVATIKMIGV